MPRVSPGSSRVPRAGPSGHGLGHLPTFACWKPVGRGKLTFGSRLCRVRREPVGWGGFSGAEEWWSWAGVLAAALFSIHFIRERWLRNTEL